MRLINLDARGERDANPMVQWHTRLDVDLYTQLTKVLQPGEYSGFTRLALRVLLGLTIGNKKALESTADHLVVSAASRDELLRLAHLLDVLKGMVMKQWKGCE